MLKKFKILLVIASLATTLSLMSNTYSRYVASSTGNVEVEFAKWQILVNETDISTNNTSNITFEPTIEKNENVADNKMAPSSTGYFDIEIDPTNVDVSFKYSIDLDIDNENIPDLVITKYTIIPESQTDKDVVVYNSLENNKLENILTYNNSPFEKFTIRVYFQWYEGENELMSDEIDTQIANTDTTFKINASINFEQVINNNTQNEVVDNSIAE